MRQWAIGLTLFTCVAAEAGCGGGRPHRSTVASASGPYAAAESVALAGMEADDEADASGAPPAPPPTKATDAPAAVQAQREALVVEGWIDLEVEDAGDVAGALRAEVEKMGGRIVSEQESGAAESWRASLTIRLPPARVEALAGWMEATGEITSKRIQATDVSRTLFDQEIALGNLRLTLDRLRKLLDAGGLSMEDILAVERELTRLRGEIERIEGEKRYLEDRVAYATLYVSITQRGGAVLRARSKLYPGPRLAVLTLLDPGGRKRTRLGGGAVVHLGIPRLTIELDVFDDVDADGERPPEEHAVLVTLGGSIYSDHFGRGRRRWLNPYIGARAGYGSLDHDAFALQAELGVEIFKHELFLIDANARATALIGDDQVDAAVVAGASAVFAF